MGHGVARGAAGGCDDRGRQVAVPRVSQSGREPRAVFGSLSSIMVLLLWLYLSAMALIIGAEYNVEREEARRVVSSE